MTADFGTNILLWAILLGLFALIVYTRIQLEPWLNRLKQRIDRRWAKIGIYDEKPVKAFSVRKQFNIFYVVCSGLILIALITKFYALIIPPALLLVVIFLTKLFPLKEEQEHFIDYSKIVSTNNPGYLIYHGYDLEFSTPELEKTLNKHLPYFSSLDVDQQQIFTKRLCKFIQRKSFIIHDTSGFKEMPILISASAIQLSFGLKKYLLPIFSEIHIYPDEFVNYNQSLRIVIGNVSNNRINISWKHFLDGFKLPDGVNVGLHEMAHAYHYQNFAALDDMDEQFMEGYKVFEKRSRTALLYELSSLSSLYTLYGLSNEQEFWAESVELFFEKPQELQALDGSLYTIISNILGQGIT